jgi:hypothetical protein
MGKLTHLQMEILTALAEVIQSVARQNQWTGRISPKVALLG